MSIVKFKNREVEINSIAHRRGARDHDDLVDSFIEEACYIDNGEYLTDDELDELTSENYDLISTDFFERGL